MSNSVWPHRRQPTRLPHPWDSPGKNTGVGCHFLLQCMKVKSESEVAQSCPTLSDPVDCSLPGSAVHGIFQARVLEWGAIAFCWKPLNQRLEPLGYTAMWGRVCWEMNFIPGTVRYHWRVMRKGWLSHSGKGIWVRWECFKLPVLGMAKLLLEFLWELLIPWMHTCLIWEASFWSVLHFGFHIIFHLNETFNCF